MKKIKFLGLLIAFGFVSCDKNEAPLDEKSRDTAELAAKQSSFYEVSSMYIDNGLSTTCENNILLFESWDKFYEIVDFLDEDIETHCDAFENSQPTTLTDEEYEAISEQLNFDEDKPLIDFETDLEFCSLRKKLYDLETTWLAQQGDGSWDENSDPDNHFIDDDTERTLFNEGVEIAIGSREGTFVIYKFFDWGYVQIQNEDYEALQQINLTGVVPENNPNVVIVREVLNSTPGCKDQVTYRNYFDTGDRTRIKTVTKIKPPFGLFFSKAKAKTKYYRKKGVWVRGKTTITARIEGKYHDSCEFETEENLNRTKKRSKVKVKFKINTALGNYIAVQDNKFYSVHKRRNDVIKTIDFYDEEIQ